MTHVLELNKKSEGKNIFSGMLQEFPLYELDLQYCAMVSAIFVFVNNRNNRKQ